MNFKSGSHMIFFGGNAVGFVVTVEVFSRLTLGGTIIVRQPLSVDPALSIEGVIVYVVLYGPSTSELCMLCITWPIHIPISC